MFYFLNFLFNCFNRPAKVNTPEPLVVGCFEIFRDRAGEYRFRLKAVNGEIILVSEAYSTKQSAKKGIDSVKKNAQVNKRYVRKKTKDKQFMFNLRAGNHEVIGTSETYTSAAGREAGIDSVKYNAPEAKVVDLA